MVALCMQLWPSVSPIAPQGDFRKGTQSRSADTTVAPFWRVLSCRRHYVPLWLTLHCGRVCSCCATCALDELSTHLRLCNTPEVAHTNEGVPVQCQVAYGVSQTLWSSARRRMV
jgi:hypothetical protein